jgi:hypothetical protein
VFIYVFQIITHPPPERPPKKGERGGTVTMIYPNIREFVQHASLKAGSWRCNQRNVRKGISFASSFALFV